MQIRRNLRPATRQHVCNMLCFSWIIIVNTIFVAPHNINEPKKMKTPKNKKAPAKLTKNINRSPFRGRTPLAATGGFIESFETAVSDIVISIVFKPDGLQGAYIKPHVDSFRSGSDVASQWYIDSIMPRRDTESNEPMKSSTGLPYHWDSIVTLRGSPEETPTEIGQKLAADFSAFSTADYQSKTFRFRRDTSDSPPRSLNHYLLDDHCILYLKKIFFGVSKDAVLADEEGLADFFGTAEQGSRIISALSDADWERKMWFD